MKEDKTMESIQRSLVKKFHTLCSLLSLSAEEKHAIVAGYGVESSRDIDTHELIDLCAHLAARVDNLTGSAELNLLRKRTIAAIGQWLRSTGQNDSLSMIKAIACRATGHKEFNRIPRERLRNIIATFNDKVRDKQRIHAELLSLMCPPSPAGQLPN